MRKLETYNGMGALITGASSGIGRHLALEIAARGARVALVARRRTELDILAEEIHAATGDPERAVAITCDVSERADVERAAAEAGARLGAIDLLVNNAGYGHHRRFLDWDLDDMERMMRVNYLGALYWTKTVLPAMVERGRGWLVFVSSVAGRLATPEESAYAASKFAMAGLADALSLEVEDSGVHVLTVYPGVIRTPFFDAEAMARMPPVARKQMVEPEALVAAIVNALARGKRELTFPRSIAAGYIARALAPEFTRRQIKRTTIDALAAEEADGGAPPAGPRRGRG